MEEKLCHTSMRQVQKDCTTVCMPHEYVPLSTPVQTSEKTFLGTAVDTIQIKENMIPSMIQNCT